MRAKPIASEQKVEKCARCGSYEDQPPVLYEGGLIKVGRDWFCIMAKPCERRANAAKVKSLPTLDVQLEG